MPSLLSSCLIGLVCRFLRNLFDLWSWTGRITIATVGVILYRHQFFTRSVIFIFRLTNIYLQKILHRRIVWFHSKWMFICLISQRISTAISNSADAASILPSVKVLRNRNDIIILADADIAIFTFIYDEFCRKPCAVWATISFDFVLYNFYGKLKMASSAVS